jgi:hypothetical protein
VPDDPLALSLPGDDTDATAARLTKTEEKPDRLANAQG